MSVLLVCLGAAVGAPLRYLTDTTIQRRVASPFPWGTFVVNAAGSLVLGVVIGIAGHQTTSGALVAGVGVGLCGGFTTYSTFAYETWRLLEGGAVTWAGHNVVASIVTGLAAAAAGIGVGQLLFAS